MNIFEEHFIKYIESKSNTQQYNTIEQFWEEIDAYNHILNNFVVLASILNINDILEIYFLYTNLLKDGYLSFNRSFEYSTTENSLDLAGYEGIDVINGKGVCRHIVDFLQKVYQRMHHESYLCSCNVECINKSNHFIIPQNIEANHAIILTQYKKAYIFLDPTIKLVLFPFKNGIIRSIDNHFMTVTNDYFRSFEVMSNEEAQKLIDKVFNSQKRYIYKHDMIIANLIVQNKILNNRQIIKEFYQSCEDDINTIANSLKTKKHNKRLPFIM